MKKITLLTFLILCLIACSNDDDNPVTQLEVVYDYQDNVIQFNGGEWYTNLDETNEAANIILSVLRDDNTLLLNSQIYMIHQVETISNDALIHLDQGNAKIVFDDLDAYLYYSDIFEFIITVSER